MRILIAYPGHSHSTRDVADGYAGALARLGHAVQTYDYHIRLSFYAEALRRWHELNPEFEADASRNLVLASEPVAIEAIDFVPDAVLVVCGLVLHRRGYELLHRLGLPLALLLTESPYLDAEQAEIIKYGYIALTLANDRASVEPLREMTGKRVEYLPHSFDPQRHYPQEVGEEYRSDVFFFGTWWPERRTLLESLLERKNGHRFELGGVGPVTDSAPELMDNDELARRYCGTKIALNHHRTICRQDESGAPVHIQDGQAWSLGPRAYEIAACGAFQLCDDTRPELKEVFGESVPTYRDGRSLWEQVSYYLEHEAEREALAAEQLARVQSCSFDNRAREILVPALENIAKE